MAYIGRTQGTNPKGNTVPLPISGNAQQATEPLAANGTWSSGWLDTSKYAGAETTIYSDVDGSYVLSFSQDGGNTSILPSININYLSDGGTRKGQFPVNATFIKFDYTNGATAQTKFLFKVDLLTQPGQSSAETLNATGSDTRTAAWTKTRIETKTSDVTNDYAPVYRTGNSLNVNVTNSTGSNPTAATVTTTLSTATSSTILPANPNRKGATFISVSGTILIKLGTGASATNYTARIITNAMYELPRPAYTGIITAIGSGTVNVTEES